MKPFTYEVADDLPSALAVLNNNGRTLKAGGIDLLDRMKERLELPGRVVSIGNIDDARRHRAERTAQAAFPRAVRISRGRGDAAGPRAGNARRQPLPASPLLVLPQHRLSLP
jgi:hypothetical protein